jgi:hypothetical protein
MNPGAASGQPINAFGSFGCAATASGSYLLSVQKRLCVAQSPRWHSLQIMGELVPRRERRVLGAVPCGATPATDFQLSARRGLFALATDVLGGSLHLAALRVVDVDVAPLLFVAPVTVCLLGFLGLRRAAQFPVEDRNAREADLARRQS